MRVLMPLPSTDFDPTESSVPFVRLSEAGHQMIVATPDGRPAAADERMLSGRGLGPWKPMLRADTNARNAYARMEQHPAFRQPIRWADAGSDQFDALLLPGGHAPGMRPYLESEHLQDIASSMLQTGKPVAAVCHGVLVLARAERRHRGRVIADRQLTALTMAQEWSALLLTIWWLGTYYRTYPISVQREVSKTLTQGGRFLTGPFALLRDAPGKLNRGFVVRDRNLLTARWPGDVHRMAETFVQMLEEAKARA
ncbi:hypothetical protein C7S18_05880 [Ahniella affigens]|uniref:Glutamine amidotransferase n=2 Tax=Ahniella affigens TaxID=2021234 RepID=A0A2P1PPJ3_9GAMM|nr:hypothetical protein C7S18_05880 [Ahniella affigens]